MGPSEFCSRGLEHSLGQRSEIHLVPKALARKLVGHDAASAGRGSAKLIAVEHLEAVDFPSLLVFDLTPETNRNIGETEIEICQVG